MTANRRPTAFGDLRGWIDVLRKDGELHEVDAEVSIDFEIGTIMRLAQGPGTGPAMLFNNLKGYNKPTNRCRRIFGSALNNNRRIAMMLGLEPDTHARDLVKLGRTILQDSIPPRIVKTGACKENVVTGKDVDLAELPAPHWNRLDGGRYLITYAGVVTKDPTTNVMNVGIYRGMVTGRDTIPILMWRAQHIGHHVTEWRARGAKEMPIAVAIGWEPSMGFCAGSPVPKGICEYDVMGAIRGEPVDLVKCETNDLYVPASAEIVIEGMLGLEEDTYQMEGPYAEFTGYFAGDRSPKPTIRVTAITHRNDPILRGTIEGCMPGSYSENAMISSIFRSSTAWNVLDRAGVPGIVDVWGPPVQASINLNVAIKQSYRGQAKQVANALWGSSAAHVRYKHVTVVDDDIDIHDYAAVDWAIAYRVNAGENDIVIMPATFGLGLDPSTRKRDRDPTLVRHRQVESGADRRHRQSRLRPRPRLRRLALSADGVAVEGGRGGGAGALEGIGARQAEAGVSLMSEESVTFPSAGLKLSGTVRVPDGVKAGEKRAAFLVLHGFGSNKNSGNVNAPTRVLNSLGYVTLGFDMRGCGDSEGEFGRVICLEQVEDTRSALTFLQTHPCGRSRPHRADRLELRRRGLGLCRRRRRARRRGDLQRRLGRRRAQVPRPAQVAGGMGALHQDAGRRQGAPRPHRQVADGAALRHRADPAAPAQQSGGELDSLVPGRDRAEHVRFPRRRRGGKDRAAAAAADPRLERFRDAHRAVGRVVQARGPAGRAASVQRCRSLPVCGGQCARLGRHARLAGEVFPGALTRRPSGYCAASPWPTLVSVGTSSLARSACDTRSITACRRASCGWPMASR